MYLVSIKQLYQWLWEDCKNVQWLRVRRNLCTRYILRAKSLQSVWLFVTLCIVCPWDSPGRNSGVGCHALLQGVFPALGWNLNFLHLLHWQVGSFPLVPPRYILVERTKPLLPGPGLWNATVLSKRATRPQKAGPALLLLVGSLHWVVTGDQVILNVSLGSWNLQVASEGFSQTPTDNRAIRQCGFAYWQVGWIP